MFTLKNIFSSIYEKVINDKEKKPIYTKVIEIKDYSTFDQQIVDRTEYLLKNKL